MNNNFKVKNIQDAKEISLKYLSDIELENVIDFGLPEVDDRYNIWRVPLLNKENVKIGEVVIDAITTLVDATKTTKKELLENRLLKRNDNVVKKKRTIPKISNLKNTVANGDSEEILRDFPSESVDLVFTSPPYYNAKPEYMEYLSYETYLLKMRKIIHECHRVLNEGRFFVLNISPVLIRRSNRNESSKRIAVPFDFHRIFIEEGYEFIDDIIWVKPEGAGWATGRGRRFAADRNPLQYKPVPVTEYILAYRKKSDKLIDWLIRKHPDQDSVEKSKIKGEYDVTNIWKICPAHSKSHPAIFPMELAERVIRYYSFQNDVVLDPFGGIGTTALAAMQMNRRFAIIEKDPNYFKEIKNNISDKLDMFSQNNEINWIMRNE